MALVAYARALTMEEPVGKGEIAALAGVVAGDQGQRIALLSALRAANSPDLASALADIIGEQAAALRDSEARLVDLDDVVGLLLQRVSVGALVAFAAAAVSGAVPVAAAIGATALAALGGVAVATVRIRLRRRRSGLARRRESAESLAERIEAELSRSKDGQG